MTSRLVESIGYLRSADGEDKLSFDGLIPYGVPSISPVAEYGKKEVFAPHAFARTAERWMARTDGARMAFRAGHKDEDIGSIVQLRDSEEGLHFRVQLDDDEAGNKYARKVRAGRNGISPEMWPNERSTTARGEYVLHHEAELMAVVGAIRPAYDGARLSLREMEEPSVAEDPKQPEPQPVPPAPEPPSMDRADPVPGRTSEQVAMERSQIREIGPKADPFTDLAFGMLRSARVYGTGTTDERGEHRSFFRDLYQATREGNGAAMERQERHNLQLRDIAHKIVQSGLSMDRAGDVLSSEIPGAYPNLYLPGLLTPRILKGRPMANFLDSFPVDNALPHIFAKVTTSTSATVQASQTTNPAASDFATTAVTATPLLYGASSLVARQVIDGASPAAESMLLQDMYEAYGQVTEAATVTAVEAGASASGTAITAATPWAGTLANVIKYQATRFGQGAEGQFYPSALYTVLLSQGDSTGRPFMPMIGLMNSDGSVASGATSGGILGAQVILSWGSTVNVVVTVKRNDYVIFESPVLNFRYEQATGPAGFNVGCWAYFVCATRLGGLSVTAA